ncbi:MAG: SDR family NAD(P)-dependent oxidoreductase [Hyphomicrobiales bacterium]|nr:MAG: SDR family NAD(P)-dependent oxidoreductase [Hyphomicrobiales bacterium]
MQRVVVITGARAGVGRATAEAFAREGASVGLIARDRQSLDEACREIQRLGVRCKAVSADVADAEAIERAATDIEEALGPIDVWVNTAMATIFGPVDDISADEFRRATEVTYLGYVHGTMAALRRMKPRRRGTIVQVGSALAYRAIPLQSAYCGAKFAIRGFTDSLRCELRHDGSPVHITMVQLPAVNTPQFDWARNKMPSRPQPVPPIFQPEVAARAIVFAAGARRREVWVGRSTVSAILANTLAPGLLDRFLGATGYKSQQTDEPASVGASDNLYKPVVGNYGAHGRFDDRAESRSLFLELSINKWPLLLAATLSALAASTVLRSRRRLRG